MLTSWPNILLFKIINYVISHNRLQSKAPISHVSFSIWTQNTVFKSWWLCFYSRYCLLYEKYSTCDLHMFIEQRRHAHQLRVLYNNLILSTPSQTNVDSVIFKARIWVLKDSNLNLTKVLFSLDDLSAKNTGIRRNEQFLCFNCL